MISKLKKPLSALCLMVVMGLLTCVIVYAKGSPNSLQFIGKNNTGITLFVDKQNLMQSNSEEENENANLEIGQVIVSNGTKEIIFAIGTDGSYITIPASD